MNHDQLKNLEDKLWDSANAMRAHGGIKASDYAVPVLGLIFLKFAENKYSQHEPEILKEYQKDKGTRMERTIQEIALAKCGFYLPDNARYDYLLKLKGNKRAEALRDAMKGIEKYQDAKFQDVLPTEAYFEIEKKKDDILPELLKSFSDIPKEASGDIFGKIYEYFLGKFAMSEGQKGGEFFTPTSVVRFIVEVIEPYKGKIYDPACGSGGMFVQSADFIAHEGHDLNDIYVYGQEYMGETVRLAKMNLLVHNLRGEITEANSYDSDPYDGLGKFDFVMANPPFNVKSVKEATVKNDERFYKYGLPKSKGKSDKISDANYLWISLFATSLNKNGRAGFVMPNSASDARHSEYDIRKNIVDSGIVDCMVSMPTNMFLTVTLPATLWFFDKQKVHTERKDKILFLDARNVYNQIDRAHREWTVENQQNLAAIVRLYRGETNRYLELIDTYIKAADQAEAKIAPAKETLVLQLEKVFKNLKKHISETKEAKRTPAKTKALKETEFFNLVQGFKRIKSKANETVLNNLAHPIERTPLDNEAQLQVAENLQWNVAQNKLESDALKQDVNTILELYKIADKNLKLSSDKVWSNYDLVKADKHLEEALQLYLEATEDAVYWCTNINWLQSRFPEAKYEDVVGLCKMADKTEYVDEQDYSLNAGRYVGVVIDGDSITKEEFEGRMELNIDKLKKLVNESNDINESIFSNLSNLI
ncbi:class I SAM-dependent DNA methyltransferase [Olleya sp. AS48]|uniref:type I restriction-modification system subunit M n=1 Tax=Olleya sp. AS48 TaxID=3135774 RepID=UPI003170EEBB